MQVRTRSITTDVSERTGRRIRRLRTERGWSYLDLHRAIVKATETDSWGPTAISPAVLRNMEDGVIISAGVRKTRWIEVGEARAIAMAFGMSIDQLIGNWT
jgi:hypothetical protein